MTPFRIAVVGAGVSGLAAAHRLTELSRRSGTPLNLSVWEASSRAGGVIRTQRRDGFLWEEGPDSFITEKPWALDLCKRLGLEAELTGTNPRAQRAFLAWKGRLHAVPEGFYMLAPSRFWPLAVTPLFSWRGKARMLLDLALPRRADSSEESLAAFVRRRLGQEALERMAQPMTSGIYAADPETLSLRATFPQFLEMEAQHGSVIRALWRRRRKSLPAKGVTPPPASGLTRPAFGGLADGGVSGPRYGLFVTLRGGLQGLVDALVRRLPPDALRLNAPVRSLARKGDGWELTLTSGEIVSADGLCLALPAPQAAALLAATDPSLASALQSIPYGGAATLHFAYERSAIQHPLDGAGFVVPAAEGRALLGCTFAGVKFPGRAPEGRALLRAFAGGAAEDAADQALIDRVQKDLEELLGIRGQPLFVSLRRHPRSMPHYTLGHLERVAAVEARVKELPRLALAGNGYRGLGLPDCVRSGESAAESLWSHAASPSGVNA